MHRICLEIGPFAGVTIDALRFGFGVVMRGSLAESAILEAIKTLGQAWCIACSGTFPIGACLGACPVCGLHPLQVVGGEELRIKELEIT